MSGQLGLSLGIDLGGTSIKAGVVTGSGEIAGRGVHPTEAAGGAEAVIANMAVAARMAADAAGVPLASLEGAGVGAPGLCSVPEGVVREAVNLGWQDVPAARLLGQALGLSVRIDNDANCAVLGEQWCGIALGGRNVLMLTLGTGIGGGLILDGRIFHGASGWAGEFGHMPAVPDGLPCNCGRRGCLETVASATAIGAAARRAAAAGLAPVIWQMAAEQQGRIDARLVIEAARAGDGPALQILRDAGACLGTAIAALVGALNPELVVIGGGASYAGELLLAPIRETMAVRTMPGPLKAVRVVQASLGNDAGLIGAASLVWRQGKKVERPNR